MAYGTGDAVVEKQNYRRPLFVAVGIVGAVLLIQVASQFSFGQSPESSTVSLSAIRRVAFPFCIESATMLNSTRCIVFIVLNVSDGLEDPVQDR